jgi:hypothetical protein
VDLPESLARVKAWLACPDRSVVMAPPYSVQAVVDALERRLADARPVPAELIEHLVRWAQSRWDAEVKDRPFENIHRKTLDETWKQVIREIPSVILSLGRPGPEVPDAG